MSVRPAQANAAGAEELANPRTGACALDLQGRVTWASQSDDPLLSVAGADPAIRGLAFDNLWVDEDRSAAQFAFSCAVLNGRGGFVGCPVHQRSDYKVNVNFEIRRDDLGVPIEVIAWLCELPADTLLQRRNENAPARLLACSGVTGRQFFTELVKGISESLGANFVYIAEIKSPGTLRPLAAYVDGRFAELDVFSPKGTPCNDVMLGSSRIISHGVQERYPSAAHLKHRGVQAYIGIPLFASDGQVIGLIGVTNDKPFRKQMHPEAIVEIFSGRAAAEIERSRAETALRNNEEKYRTIADAISVLVAFMDTEERYQFANAAYYKWFGLQPAQLKGRHLASVLGEAAYRGVRPFIKRALAGEGISYEQRIPYLIGGERDVRVEYVPHVLDGQVEGYFSFVFDLTRRQSSEEPPRESEVQFRALFEHLPIGAALVDVDGAIVLENEVFGRLMPLDPRSEDQRFYARGSISDSEKGSDICDHQHPVRLALSGQVVRDAEYYSQYVDGRKIWIRMSAVPVRNHRNIVTGALVVVADIHCEKRADERRTLLINELNHRVKNTLASVQSIASQTFRASLFAADGLDAFESRLLALSDAHSLLTREGWEGVDLRQVVSLALEPHNPGGRRLVATGPWVLLKPPAALAFAMALHELATNAVKYGAFSVMTGTVTVAWQVVGVGSCRRLNFSWVERGGPVVLPPQRKGFGTRLIERSLAFELGSTTSIQFLSEGVQCLIDAELAEISG